MENVFEVSLRFVSEYRSGSNNRPVLMLAHLQLAILTPDFLFIPCNIVCNGISKHHSQNKTASG